MTNAASPLLGRALFEERLGRLEGVNGPQDVQPEVLLPRLGIHALGHGAGIGDEDVDAAQLAGCLLDPGSERGAVRDVDGAAEGAHAFILQRSDRLAHLIGFARADGDVGAFVRERVGDGASDTARTAQYDGALLLELKVHECLPEFLSGLL